MKTKTIFLIFSLTTTVANTIPSLADNLVNKLEFNNIKTSPTSINFSHDFKIQKRFHLKDRSFVLLESTLFELDEKDGFSPIYFNSFGVEEGTVIEVVPDKKNGLYVSTTNGFFYIKNNRSDDSNSIGSKSIRSLGTNTMPNQVQLFSAESPYLKSNSDEGVFTEITKEQYFDANQKTDYIKKFGIELNIASDLDGGFDKDSAVEISFHSPKEHTSRKVNLTSSYGLTADEVTQPFVNKKGEIFLNTSKGLLVLTDYADGFYLAGSQLLSGTNIYLENKIFRYSTDLKIIEVSSNKGISFDTLISQEEADQIYRLSKYLVVTTKNNELILVNSSNLKTKRLYFTSKITSVDICSSGNVVVGTGDGLYIARPGAPVATKLTNFKDGVDLVEIFPSGKVLVLSGSTESVSKLPIYKFSGLPTYKTLQARRLSGNYSNGDTISSEIEEFNIK